MLDPSKYIIGPGCSAGLLDGATLYRLTSLAHSDVGSLLTGEGASRSDNPGRFNEPQQRASYCGTNVLVCLAEVLFHMYRTALDRTRKRLPPAMIRSAASAARALSVFEVSGIDSLIYLDTDDVRADYDGRITGSTVVFPDPDYEPLRDVNQRFRVEGKRGVMYPSARHSRDVCLVLFRDETTCVIPGSHIVIPVELKLIREDQDVRRAPGVVDAFMEKIHATMGYYEFVDQSRFAQARVDSRIHPQGLPPRGTVDFVRRRYVSYPLEAVCECA
ncbi:MAG: RES family NAD+ phosphorylase [Acidobacteriota bacterium]